MKYAPIFLLFCVSNAFGQTISKSSLSALGSTYTNTQNIRKMAECKCKVTVRREGRMTEVMSGDLVPGDLVVMPKDSI